MPRTKKPWTCLFYLCGDNYLAKYVEDDFREICAAGASPTVHVAVQIDRPTGAARYVLPERRQRRPPEPDLALGNVNTGDPAAAIDFLAWGMREFPSARLAVILSGPGLPTMPKKGKATGATRDDLFTLFPDETSKDALNAAELRHLFQESLSRARRRRVDLVGLDSCSHAFLEVAYQLEGLTTLLVAPQTFLPGQGWPYERLLTAWRRRRPADPESLARLLVSEVIAAYRQEKDPPQIALSAIDLRALDQVARSLDTLTLGLMQCLGDKAVLTALKDTRRRSQGIEWPENVDLLELLTLAGQMLQRRQARASNVFGEKARAAALVDLFARTRAVIRGEAGGPPLVLANASLARQPLHGVSIHFPRSLAGSSYLDLRFARKVHWAALLGGMNLIEDHPRALWRLVSALMADAGGGTRQELINRMLGPASVMESLKTQFRALESPLCLTLSLERRDDLASPQAEAPSARVEAQRLYRLRLEGPDAGATIAESTSRVNQRTFDTVLSRLERVLNDPSADAEALPQIVSLGRTLWEDLLCNLGARLHTAAAPVPAGEIGESDRAAGDQSAPHLRLQIAAELMRHPWELLQDGEELLGLRYALGRQVFMDAPTLRQARRRTAGSIRVLVIGDPVFTPAFLEDLRRQKRPVPPQLPEAREEAQRVAQEFERLRDELAGLPPLHVESVVGDTLSVTEMRERLRDGYHIIHFAGHGVFRKGDPETSAWLLSDGELWAREIRNTLAGLEEPPWLIFANACEAGMDAGTPVGRYQGDVFGLATACINQGVAAYVAPLWPVQDVLAAELAADFYRELVLNRASVGEALRRAKVRARGSKGAGDAARQLTWASFVLYGDPTQQLLRSLWSGSAQPSAKKKASPSRVSEEQVRALVAGPGMRSLAARGMRGAPTLQKGEAALQLVEKNGVRFWQAVSGEKAPRPLGIGTRLAEAATKTAGERGVLDVLRVVGTWAVGAITGKKQSLITALARQYDQDTVAEQRLLRIGSDGTCTPLEPQPWTWLYATPQPGQTDRILLFIHGTFSQTSVPVADFSPAFLAWANRTYRAVLGFDHWTLSLTPEENAKFFWDLLDPALRTGHRLDIITHSRGGLVARAFVELLGHGEAVRRVIFVGTPNAGTNLANPKNWGTVADVLINLAPISAPFAKLSGLLARLLIAGAEGRIPGLQAQNPTATGSGDFLGRIQRPTTLPQGVSYSAVAANFEPEPGGFNPRHLLDQVGDVGADAFYGHPNDLVVDTGSVWSVNAKPDYDLTTENETVPRVLLFNPEGRGVGQVVRKRGVHHNNLFSLPETMAFLQSELA
jgi:CHAT domain/Clostripain family